MNTETVVPFKKKTAIYHVVGTDTITRRYICPTLEEFQTPEKSRILLATFSERHKADDLAYSLNNYFKLLMYVTVEEHFY